MSERPDKDDPLPEDNQVPGDVEYVPGDDEELPVDTELPDNDVPDR
ncbi:MAG: hypothetical protein QRY16_12250 [Enterobacterales bacterium endosymbiont of Blomia tropicalis]|nr:hypothetical protein [Mixta mediterraneensis]MDL4914528.1 hypothetical protein [Mixta mediterraneensis]